jgi:hypothetical protein
MRQGGLSQISFPLLKAGQAEDKAIEGSQEYGLGRDVGILAGIRQSGAGGAEIEDLREIAGKGGDLGSKSVAVPEDLYNKAAAFAAEDHVSVEQFVSTVLANQLASREYLESRAKLFNREEFERALNGIPDVEPEDHDRP